MTTLLIPIAIAVLLVLLLVHDLITDPRGARRPPVSHQRDARFLPPSRRL